MQRPAGTAGRGVPLCACHLPPVAPPPACPSRAPWCLGFPAGVLLVKHHERHHRPCSRRGREPQGPGAAAAQYKREPRPALRLQRARGRCRAAAPMQHACLLSSCPCAGPRLHAASGDGWTGHGPGRQEAAASAAAVTRAARRPARIPPVLTRPHLHSTRRESRRRRQCTIRAAFPAAVAALLPPARQRAAAGGGRPRRLYSTPAKLEDPLLAHHP